MKKEWKESGLWEIGPSNTIYPKRIRKKFLYKQKRLWGAGDKNLLNKKGIAVVGHRNADQESLDFARKLGQHAANQEIAIISGCASGIDETAMLGSLESGGIAIGVTPGNFLQTVKSEKWSKYLLNGQLTLISLCMPETKFSVNHAMNRNKYIYCLSKAAVVVNCVNKKGGTWKGALETLLWKWVPVKVWTPNSEIDSKSGNAVLIERGATRFKNEDLKNLSSLWGEK